MSSTSNPGSVTSVKQQKSNSNSLRSSTPFDPYELKEIYSSTLSDPTTLNNDTTQPSGFLYFWLKLTTYTLHDTCCSIPALYYRIIAFISIGIGLAMEYWTATWADYHDYDHIIEIAYVGSTLVIFWYLQRNLNENGVCFGEHKNVNIFLSHGKCEYTSYVIILFTIILCIRFSIFTPLICDEAQTWDHIIGHPVAFCINMVVMYTLDFTICNICLAFVEKFNKLKEEIKTTRIVEEFEIEALHTQVQAMVEEWWIVVSISVLYHLLYGTLVVVLWIFTLNNHLWHYCYSDSFSQLIFIIIRCVVRIYGLLYGIFRLNHEYDALATVVSVSGGWKKGQSTNASRMKDNLQNEYARFKVCGINIKWKICTLGILGWTAVLFLATALKIRFDNTIVRA